MIPLYAFLEGDTIGLLLLAMPEDSCDDLVKRLIQMARSRVAAVGPYTLEFRGKAQLGSITVSELGLAPLDRVDVRKREAV